MVRRDLGLNRRGFLQAVGLAGIAAAQPAFAQLFVNIQGVGANQFPIAIQPFFGNSEAPENIAEIIGNDLVRSGFFRLVSCDAATALDKDPDWKALGTAGVGAFADGSVTRAADGRYEIKFRLFDPVKKQETDEASYISPKDDLRLYAHKIADRIFERLTGEKGDFATRIAYVSQQGKNNYAIMVADSDGYNPQVALRIRHPIISIDWSPNGRQIAYTSFETGKPTVWIHDLSTGKRRQVAAFRGNNSAPAFSPDGGTLAVALSKDGGTKIYLLDTNGENLRQITTGGSNDTEPACS